MVYFIYYYLFTVIYLHYLYYTFIIYTIIRIPSFNNLYRSLSIRYLAFIETKFSWFSVLINSNMKYTND